MTVLDLPGSSIPSMPGDAWALFLDVDGTLLELRNTPGQVVASRDVMRLLPLLLDHFGGAVALLSGRTIADLDRIFHPLKLPCAGVHGAERRDTRGLVSRIPAEADALAGARTEFSALARRNPGMLVEDKGLGIALHSRLAPHAADAAHALARAHADASGGRLRVQRGKHVAELKPAAAAKGTALTAFLAEPGFAGRLPLAVGDDVTDADSFEAARRLGGCAVGVGPSAIGANYHLPTPAACRRWLWHLLDHDRAG